MGRTKIEATIKIPIRSIKMLVVIFLITTFQKKKAISIKTKIDNYAYDKQYNIKRFIRNQLTYDKTCNDYICCVS